MSFLKMTIPGDYWDVQIYRGKLHLWTMSGSLITLDWSELVSRVAEAAHSPLAVRIGLAQGEALYSKQTNPLLHEWEFRSWLQSRFDLQSEQHLEVDFNLLQDVTVGEQDNPTDDLPVDTEIYNRYLYATTTQGVWKGSVGGRTKLPISTKPIKLHDLPAVSVRARSNQLALAASGDGLYRLGIGSDSMWDTWRQGFHCMSERHCERADWVFQSVFAGSSLSGGYLVSRYWSQDREDDERAAAHPHLEDGGTYPVGEISGALQDYSASWAYAEKIYTANDSHLASARYTQKEIPNGISVASTDLGAIELTQTLGRPVTGSAGVFGTVVEYDNGLQVVQSDESQFAIEGPVTRWRVYPRATNYENHLHVILEDCLQVFGFYRDYFSDQDKKRFGVAYESTPQRRFAS